MILVITEIKAGATLKFNPASLEALACGQQLGRALGMKVQAVVLEGTESALASELAGFDLERVNVARHAALGAYSPDTWTQALVQITTQLAPRYVVLPHTYQVRDYAPQLATRMGAGLISDVVSFEAGAEGPQFMRPMFQGKFLAATRFRELAAGTPGFLTVQIGAFRRDSLVAGTAPVVPVTVSPEASRLQAGEIFQEAKQAVDLTQAELIVAVGRGIKEPKNLDLVRDLAQALGAELAASRPICDNGWLPMDRQIGSSGQTVAPKLYLAVGISGAIQHLVGMKGSRAIIAINKDPEAPIFEVADYAVVGNLFDIVPQLTAAIRKAREA